MYDVFSNSGLSDQAILSRDPKGSLPIPVSFFNSVLDVGVKRPFFMKDDPKASRSALFVSEQDADSEGFTANAHFLLNETTEWGLFLDGLRDCRLVTTNTDPLLYLDIDGVLLRRRHAGMFDAFEIAPYCVEFLEWATSRFQCRWASSRCRAGWPDGTRRAFRHAGLGWVMPDGRCSI